MTQDEARHAKKMEQIMASIDEKLERIAKSLEKMEPTVYKIPRLDIPLNDTNINVPPDQYLRTITADESANVKNPAGVDNPASIENPAGVDNDSKSRSWQQFWGLIDMAKP